jgi:hypothetical protein
MTSFFHDLEEQLRAAAHERTGTRPTPVPAPESSRRHWRLSRGLRVVPVLVAVAVTLAVVVGALVLLGHRGGQPPVAPASGGPGNAFAALVEKTPKAELRREFALIGAATRKVGNAPACAQRPNQGGVVRGAPGQALLATLGVLRRAATPADRLDLRSLGLGGPGMTIYADGARRGLIAGGSTYYIVPIHVAASAGYPSARCFSLQAQALKQSLPTIPAKLRTPTLALQAAFVDYDRRLSATPPEDGVCVVSRSGRGNSSECGETLSAIRRPLIPSDDGGAYRGVVPDGVASVTLSFPATASHAATSVTGVVHNNLFVVRAAARIPSKLTAQPTVVWRNSDGKVLRSLTPPSPASLKTLCLDHPESCAPMVTMSASSRSAPAGKLTAAPVGASRSTSQSKK